MTSRILDPCAGINPRPTTPSNSVGASSHGTGAEERPGMVVDGFERLLILDPMVFIDGLAEVGSGLGLLCCCSGIRMEEMYYWRIIVSEKNDLF